MFSKSNQWSGSHDSGVAASSFSTSKSYSNSKIVLPSVLNNNMMPPRAPPPPFSAPPSFEDLQPCQTSSFRNMAPSQTTVNHCSCCSHSSNHLCPTTISKIISGDGCAWQNTGYSCNPGVRGYSNINFSSYGSSSHHTGYYHLPSTQVAVSNPERPKLGVPPINSKRLRPLRQKTKNVVLNIMDMGEVCLEFLRNKGGEEKVVEVLRISSDGLRIVLYQPDKGKGVSISEQPPGLPSGGTDELFSYENIPQKYWKKYTHASKFVDAVKTKTAKVIYYSSKAKCFLMENSPDPDFEVAFYEGAKVYKSGDQVKIVDTNGLTKTVHVTTDGIDFSPSVKLIWNQFKSYLTHCLNIEKTMEQLSLSTKEDVFPIVIGRRPTISGFQRTLQSSKKEISAIMSPTSEPVEVGSHTGSVSSSLQGPKASRNKILKQIHIPNIGHAVQMASGIVCIQYPDSCKLFVDPSSSKISFLDYDGSITTYQQSDDIPQEILVKLGKMSIVIESLMNAS